MLVIVRVLEEQRAELKGLQVDPFKVYSDYRALEYFMTTKKLLARQARQVELLSRYHFILIYRAGKSNERADALSRKHEDIKEQDRIIAEYRTQTLLPASKIDLRIVSELQLAAITAPKQTPTEYDVVQLINKILSENRTSEELEELRIKAQNGNEQTWQLKDGLLY